MQKEFEEFERQLEAARKLYLHVWRGFLMRAAFWDNWIEVQNLKRKSAAAARPS